jgi:3-methyladenine DNA glycosylase AlkD
LKTPRPTETKELSVLENEIRARLSQLEHPNTEAIRAIRREFSRRLAKGPPEQVISLALKLSQGSAPRFFAYELIQHHKQALQSLKPGTLEELGMGNDSWETVDAFACFLSGPSWREGEASDALIHRWARSSDRWWRRAALVSTVPLNNKARGGHGDTARTLMICKLLLEDRDEMVVKALSWALRELSKRDPGAVRKFVREHAGALAPRVVREVNNKLKTGLKNPRSN